MSAPPPSSLPLTVPALDRLAHRRDDDSWLLTQWAAPQARVAVFVGDRVLTRPGTTPGVQWVRPTELAEQPTGDWVFLGGDPEGVPYFAVQRDDDSLPTDRLVGVRELGLALTDEPELGIIVGAVAVLNWHRRHPRCAVCGGVTDIAGAGWIRRCPVDDSQHFPRVDPAVIMLVHDDQDRALLGRQARWPPQWFSTLAGFVEPGETLENAVAREVHEESGITVGDIDYRGSQPWPFPGSLMLGFHARARTTDLRPDGGEIAEARWFTRAELSTQCAAGEIRLPPRFSISRWLIELWFGAALPGDWSRQ